MAQARALIVTTHDLLARGIEALLSRMGVTAWDRVWSWQEARTVLETDPPDVIVVTAWDVDRLFEEVGAYLLRVRRDVALLAVDINEDRGIFLQRRELPHVTAEEVAQLLGSTRALPSAGVF